MVGPPRWSRRLATNVVLCLLVFVALVGAWANVGNLASTSGITTLSLSLLYGTLGVNVVCGLALVYHGARALISSLDPKPRPAPRRF